MSSKYVSQDEIKAHEAAMQRVVEDEKKEQKAINDKRKMANEAAQRAFDEAMKAAEDEADQELKISKSSKNKKLATMQRDFNHLPLVRQVYHEAPDDVFELVVSECCSRYRGEGGLNAFRLANRRLKQVVESCTSRLTNLRFFNGPESLPIPIIKRCGRIEVIRCHSHNLRSLEGCPNGLKRLSIGRALHLSDLSPLATCSMMQCLALEESSIIDISVVASMPLLEAFMCTKVGIGRPSIKDLSPLSCCPRLHTLFLCGNRELKDLSPLSACSALVRLVIAYSPLITSLAPLSRLKNLEALDCRGIHPETSLLPLASCAGLKELKCRPDAVDLEELRKRRPDLIVTPQ